MFETPDRILLEIYTPAGRRKSFFPLVVAAGYPLGAVLLRAEKIALGRLA
jgi:hypothetical protein